MKYEGMISSLIIIFAAVICLFPLSATTQTTVTIPITPPVSFSEAWNDLQGNITSTPNSNTYVLSLASGTYSTAVNLTLTSGSQFTGVVTITGPSATDLAVVNCLNGVDLNVVQGTVAYSINWANVQFVNCASMLITPGGSVSWSNVHVSGCVIPASTTPSIQFKTTTQVTIVDSSFQNCVCEGSCSGSVLLAFGNPAGAFHSNLIQNTNFLNNLVGASAIITTGDDVDIVGCSFLYNFAKSIISVQNVKSAQLVVHVVNSLFQDNLASQDGVISGGSGSTAGSNITVSGTVITDNTARLNAPVIGVFSGAHDTIIIAADSFVGQNHQDLITCGSGTGQVLNAIHQNICTDATLGGCPAGQSFDRCFVCGGQSACLGCDNIPYSTATCATPAAVVANVTGPNGSIAVWPTGAPDATLHPPGAQSTAQAINITVGTIIERDSSGAAAQTLDMSNLPWLVTEEFGTDSYTRNFQFWQADDTNATVILSETLYGSAASITSGDVTFQIGNNALKFTLTVEHWDWKGPSNTLEVDLSFATSETPTGQSSSTSTANGFQILTVVVNTATTQVTANLQEFAIVDSVTTAIQVTAAQSGATQSFNFQFPHFTSSLVYDPDFGVLLQNNNNGDGGGSSNTPLIAGLAGGLGGLAVLVVVVTILLAVVLGWWKLFKHDYITKRRSSSMVNFDPADEDIEVSSSE